MLSKLFQFLKPSLTRIYSAFNLGGSGRRSNTLIFFFYFAVAAILAAIVVTFSTHSVARQIPMMRIGYQTECPGPEICGTLNPPLACVNDMGDPIPCYKSGRYCVPCS